jgi:acetylornithine aminotransferase
MRAGLETIAAIEADGLLKNAADRGAQINASLARELAGVAGVTEIRGRGLMIGIELARPCSELVAQARDAGLLINVTADRVVRLLPALTLTAAEADEIVARLAPLIRAHLQQAVV